MIEDWGPFWLATLGAIITTLSVHGTLTFFFLLWIALLIIAWRFAPR